MKTALGLVLILGLAAAPNCSALDLKQLHPDEPADYTFNTRFSVENALRSADQVSSIFNSFRKLTDASRGKLPVKKLKEIGNTDSEMQTLGFTNIPGAIKGTLLKQDYQIKKLRYEALQLAKAEPDKLASAQKDFKQAEETFQKYWNSFGISD